MLGSDQGLALQLLTKGRNNCLIVEDCPCNYNLTAQFSRADYFGQIILGDRGSKTGCDNFERYTLLLSRSDRLAHEGGAPGSKVDGIRCREGQPGKIAIRYGNSQHLTQFINEAAGSSSTRLVHLVVNDNAVPLDN